MTQWLPFKATPPERKGGRARQQNNRPRLCKICGKPAYIGNICGSCKRFIDGKKTEEGIEQYGKYRNQNNDK